MTARHTRQLNDRHRARIDRLTTLLVSTSGLTVLFILMLMFIYLLNTVWPLFKPITLGNPVQLSEPSSAQALALNSDPLNRVIYRIDASGNGQFLAAPSPLSPTGDKKPSHILSTALSEPLSAIAMTAKNHYALGQTNGAVVMIQPQFSTTGFPSWHYLFGSEPLQFDPLQHALAQLAVANIAPQQFMLAALTDDRRLLFALLTAQGIQPIPVPSMPQNIMQVLLTPDASQLLVVSGTQLHRYQITINEHADSEKERVSLHPLPTESLGLNTTAQNMLLAGGNTLLLLQQNGALTEGFDTTEGFRLRHYQHQTHAATATQAEKSDQPLTRLVSEQHRRVFATLDALGYLDIYSSVKAEPLLQTKLPLQSHLLSFTPAGNGLLIEDAKGVWLYPLENRYPDISWNTLWQKTWYENYPESEYIWQSTSGDETYQPKFSLLPLIYGTLKAALYAMLIAIPPALAGAAYTAYFMSAALRKIIKPAVEIMGAIPSVVIGLLAGIWLAPIVEKYLLSVLLLPILLTAVILFCGYLVSILPERLNRCLNGGWDIILLLPIIAAVTIGLFKCNATLEHSLFAGDLIHWMNVSYEQRNTLIVGIAMGFALIPIIFSLAEDALFSVPTGLSRGSLALGASRWQTLIRVVLPAASAGIFSALMLGFGRAIGETMIVLMATGNTPLMDASVFTGLRSMAANIAIEMPEAVNGSGHYRVLFITAFVLFVFTFIFNSLAELIRLRLRERYNQDRHI